jgi:hypothetical protein
MRIFFLGILVLGALAAGGASAEDRVGVTAAVNPATTGQAPGLEIRTLFLGDAVLFNEKIRTEAAGQAQIVFLDRSSFNVGPSSEIVVDEFVYDKNSGSGHLAVTATKGVFRYVGGALSKNPDAVTIKTPTATIGIRGGIVIGNVAPDGQVSVTFVYGVGATVTTSSGTVSLVRPGFGTTVAGQGTSPTAPVPVPSTEIASTIGALDGTPAASGGATQAPTPVLVQQSGVSQTNSAAPSTTTTTQNAAASQTTTAPAPPTAPIQPPQQILQSNPTGFPPLATAFLADQQRKGEPYPGFFAAGNADPNFALLQALSTSAFPPGFGTLATRTDDSAQPLTGIATYSGTTFAAVRNGGLQSLSTGTASATVDFSVSKVAFTFANVGGITFSGSGFFNQQNQHGIPFFGANGEPGVVFGGFFNGTQRLFGDFLIQPSAASGGSQNTNGFFATGFFDAAQTGFSDPFAALTQLLVNSAVVTAVAPSGTPSDPANLVAINFPPNGVATYNGTTIVAVSTGGSGSLAAGSYLGSFDFGHGTGNSTVTFPVAGSPQSFTAPVNLKGGNFFGGSLTQFAGGPVVGTLQGTFYDVSGVIASQQAGSFALATGGFSAVGKFLGTRP